MDIYDEEVEYLKENPKKIKDHWNVWSPLFRSADGKKKFGESIGCLTQIKAGTKTSGFSELDDRIKADNNIPDNPDNITVDHLDTFAQYQRKLDELYPRVEIKSYIPSYYEK